MVGKTYTKTWEKGGSKRDQISLAMDVFSWNGLYGVPISNTKGLEWLGMVWNGRVGIGCPGSGGCRVRDVCCLALEVQTMRILEWTEERILGQCLEFRTMRIMTRQKQ